MDPSNIDEKYKKLATEYSKLRAQAGVLKRAVIEEQNKNATLREAFRVKETNLRRVEQEVDSLGFRNKQLEHRVASLQDDLTTINAGNSKKSGKLLNRQSSTHQTTGNTASPPPHESDSIFNEELQKKIVECAQLSSTVADKSSEIQLQYNRISELEDLIHRMNAEHSDAEAKLRSEIARLTTANHEMETKLTEASSIVSSDDTIFVTDCDPITKASANGSTSNGSNVNNCKLEERLAVLEKEVIAWQTQCETLEIAAKMANETNDIKDIDGNLKTIDADIKNAPIEGEEHSGQQLTGREQMLVDHFQKKCEKLLVDKLVAESKLVLFMEESESLQKHLDIVNSDLKQQARKFHESQRNLQMADEDLATTRINYEEQISVLTEQVLSLSDRLAELN